MKLTIPAILLLFFSFSTLYCTAQETSSKTLLWRISGNGLAKPSYLYGTMHLKDRRLFFFGDSVYKSIEASAGFAMELDPNEMMDSMFSKIGEADTTSLLRKLLDEKKFKSVAKKLEKKFGMPADKITRKQLIAERENWYYKVHKSDDMKTVVDMYLYDIAHKQGKWVGGIEDVNDQSGIMDELGKNVNIVDYVDDDNDAERKNYLEKMVATYTDGNIDKIDRIMSGSQSQHARDILLVNRNIKMASRMDSLSHIRNSFFAVGAAHLPGVTGLIYLLKGKGFTVTPVFSSKKIAPEKYAYTAKEIPWVKFSQEDSAYMAEMPGKASDLKLKSEEVKLKVYADLVSNTVYMTGFSFIATDETPESSMDRMIRSFSSNGFEKNNVKKVANNGIDGKEIVAIRENIYYRMQVFTVEGKVFIIMAGGEKKENLYTGDVERFLQSFTMNAKLAAKPNSWVIFSDTLKAFDITFPKKPSADKLKEGEGDPNFETTTYSAIDIPNSTYYLLAVSDTKKGFVILDDSLIFNSKLNYYKENKAVINDLRKFSFEGNGAMSFSAMMNNNGVDLVTKSLVVCRGNRSYFIAVVTSKGREDFPDVTRFFRSFKLAPYKENVWEIKEAHNGQFSTWAPSAFERDKPDTAGLSGTALENALTESAKTVQLIASEPYSVTNYIIIARPVSKYYWAKEDSSFLAEQADTYYSDSTAAFARQNPGRYDSLVYKKSITNGSVTGVEIMVKNAAKSYYKRVRILPHGDSSYHIFVMAPYSIITNENNNKFFDSFRFSNEALPSTILINKTAAILAGLAGKDSAEKADATVAMQHAKFEAADLALLYKAYLKQYPVDTLEYTSVNEKIASAINKVNDSSVISFVKYNYLSGTDSLPELKTGMLEMLANQQTKKATALLKELLLKAPPAKGNPNSLIYRLCDSLLMAADLFPEAGRFFGDSLLGPGMLRLASQLIDSNILQKDILTAHTEGILHTANVQLMQLKKDGEDYPANNKFVLDALGKLNNPQSIRMLNGFVTINDLYTKQDAVLALLKIKQPVSPLELRRIAADKAYRTGFYTQLKDAGRQQLFPAEFLTQPSFAEGYIYNYASEEDAENIECKMIGERVASIKGVQRRFYLFKVSFNYDGEPQSYLAICGRFDINRKNVELKDNEQTVKIFYEEKYAAASVNKLFAAFIATENNEGAAVDEK